MTADDARPEFVFDGDCGICTEWVNYYRALTGGRVRYRPYQEAAADHPEIPIEALQRAVHLIDPDGSVTSGAGATFKLYRGIRPQVLLDIAYRRLPGFASLSEWGYRFFSQRRGLLRRLTHVLWGRNHQPASFHAVSFLFLRLLGIVYFAAFVSFGVQAGLLIGSEGLLPMERYLAQLEAQTGPRAYLLAPTVFWLWNADSALRLACLLGGLCGLSIACNLLVRTSLVLAFLMYLSITVAGQAFMAFQWDMLLLEAGFLAILLSSGARVVVWLYRWLLFRFMFLGGVVKLVSGDVTWRNLTALGYHFETQPLPTPLAWYAHHLPEVLLQASVAATLAIELLMPFLIFAPRRPRMLAAACFLVLQIAILATGNYNFFNILTIVLCLFLFDDAALGSALPRRIGGFLPQPRLGRPGRIGAVTVWCLAGVIVFSAGEHLIRTLQNDRGNRTALTRYVSICRCVNGYGPFAVMTTARNEIVIEGTTDGVLWEAYEFKYKPGALDRANGWIIPHQPRVDWQMWFAALSRPEYEPWLQNLLARILMGSDSIDDLFAVNPFPEAPPSAVRARFYRYHFTDPEERAATGRWWRRELLGLYFPVSRLER